MLFNVVCVIRLIATDVILLSLAFGKRFPSSQDLANSLRIERITHIENDYVSEETAQKTMAIPKFEIGNCPRQWIV